MPKPFIIDTSMLRRVPNLISEDPSIVTPVCSYSPPAPFRENFAAAKKNEARKTDQVQQSRTKPNAK
ncbi:uncharacterized protein VTP21DRAFT_6216 [Calcarisporiella thermophila]|uniref:uncharacterized protein n=1 Tax=Calcarisporiella thermophila TaxID=911321 RepID=UPI0037434080